MPRVIARTDHARITAERCLRSWVDREGAWNLHARGTVDQGARFEQAIAPILDQIFETNRNAATREPREAYAFDALVELTTREPDTGDDKKPVRPKPQYMSLVRVDYTALARGDVDGEEVCEIAGLGPIPVSTARTILGESILILVITKGVDVAHVTHLGRHPIVAQQVALWWKDPICAAEGCNRVARLQNDHRADWAHTHRTELKQLDRLCEHCHDLKTRHGWTLVEGTGRRPMVPPDNPRHPKNKPKREPPERAA